MMKLLNWIQMNGGRLTSDEAINTLIYRDLTFAIENTAKQNKTHTVHHKSVK